MLVHAANASMLHQVWPRLLRASYAKPGTDWVGSTRLLREARRHRDGVGWYTSVASTIQRCGTDSDMAYGGTAAL
eukprot:196950-Rhodomonas_salina.1